MISWSTLQNFHILFSIQLIYVIFVLKVLFWLSDPNVEAIPRRGNEPWSLILCKFADLHSYEPRSREWFEQWLRGDDEDSIESYFAQVSNGIYTISGSNLHGWFTLSHTQNDVLRLANSDPKLVIGSDSSFDYFDKIKELCVQVALENGALLHRQKITVINAGTTAVYGKKHGVLLTPHLMFPSVLTHEMVHSFFIGHSYSDRKIRVFPYALSGEYDDRYDLMSTANAYMHRSKYGMSGPGLNGAHLDFLGWLPLDRLLYFGRDGRQNYTLRLSSLSVPHNSTRGWLLVMIPYDRNDPHNYYTVELRTPHRFDLGITQASVLIHRVQKVGESYYSVLLSQAHDFYELTENTEWVKFLEANTAGHFQLLRVTVRRIYAHDADIHISSTFDPNECHLGETTHSVVALDPRSDVSHVCLSNADRNGVSGDTNDTSLIDRVVPTDVDLQRQFARKNFYNLQSTIGANACRTGHIWRALDAYDYVCVTPKRQEIVMNETNKQEERIGLNGTGCSEPFLPRRAFPSDDICVTPSEKFRTFRENIQSSHQLLHFAFFNGVDTVGP
ncbi:hypothetical protein DdX_00025 [Ditylenchus destructor]|uniref:Uncharacterized protein n=1 Tax=Ditylenchus destructor TaxID=166010 RepID=A0AAD4ND21_9BILA|nr:hypothetical protein DdX_00025 [Ditylenchus destructor]